MLGEFVFKKNKLGANVPQIARVPKSSYVTLQNCDTPFVLYGLATNNTSHTNNNYVDT